MNNNLKLFFKLLAFVAIIVSCIAFFLQIYSLFFNIRFGRYDIDARFLNAVFNNISENIKILLWGLVISSAILFLSKYLSGENIAAKKIESEKAEELNLLEVDNSMKGINVDSENLKPQEYWVCKYCDNRNEMYLIKCNKCYKIRE